jgi:fumarate reductase subunit C
MGMPTATTTRATAWLDLAQGLTGLILVLFMWAHMVLVSSILLGEDAMFIVTKALEGQFLFGRSYPGLVSAVAVGVLAVFLAHALVAIRKLPGSYREYRVFWRHARGLGHADTTLWLVQVVTGFLLMFFAAAHLNQMMFHPGDIGPYASADRVWSGRWWPFYLVLLFAVELHGGIGIYRLALKWGWFADREGRLPRRRLQRAKWALTAFFLVLGMLTLGAYMKLGYEHRDAVGERYRPALTAVEAP